MSKNLTAYQVTPAPDIAEVSAVKLERLSTRFLLGPRRLCWRSKLQSGLAAFNICLQHNIFHQFCSVNLWPVIRAHRRAQVLLSLSFRPFPKCQLKIEGKSGLWFLDIMRYLHLIIHYSSWITACFTPSIPGKIQHKNPNLAKEIRV